jgi:hypothetical protein
MKGEREKRKKEQERHIPPSNFFLKKGQVDMSCQSSQGVKREMLLA